MGALEGRVAIITGAGRGLGREHALLFAAEGAKVVINDVGGANDGSGSDATPAEEVVAEIKAQGGEAVANADDISDWDGAQGLVNSAIEAFGDLDILVNNAGILRDRVLVNMTEQEWDDVVRVHLKGHFAPSRWAAAYWREEAKAGARSRATSSTRRARRGCCRTRARATTAPPSPASPRSARSSPRSSCATASRATASPRPPAPA